MADDEINIKVKVNAETGALEVVGAQLKNTASKAKEVDDSFFNLDKTTTNLIKTYAGIRGAKMLLDFFVTSVKEAEEYNITLRKVIVSLDSAGKGFGGASKAVGEWAQQIQKSTKYSDDEALKVLEKFIRITGDLKQAQSATTLAMNMTTKGTQDLSTNVENITGLILNKSRALMQVNQEFRQATGNAKNNEEALENLSKALEGSAEKEENLTVKTSKLSHSWDDTKKSIGNALLPLANVGVDILVPILGYFQEIIDKIVLAGKLIISFVKADSGAVLSILRGDFTEAKNYVSQFTSESEKLLSDFNKNNKKLIDDGVKDHEKSEKIKTIETKEQLAERLKAEKEMEAKGKKQTEQHTKDEMDRRRKSDDEQINLTIERSKNDLRIAQDMANDEKDIQKEIADFEKKSNEERKQGAQEVAQFTSQEFGKAFADIIMESKSADEAFQQMGQNIIRMTIQMITQMMILKALTGSMTGGGTGGLLGFLFSAPSAGGGTMGAPSSRGSGVPSIGEAGGQGNINQYFNLSVDKLDISKGDAAVRALADLIAQKTPGARKFALGIKKLQNENAGLAT